MSAEGALRWNLPVDFLIKIPREVLASRCPKAEIYRNRVSETITTMLCFR